ncbi:MAG: carboxylesterase family protein [Candidatus Lokiarchaeota archaeon]|nr:carboxylesterase family protein [Candidatus Lokiarchaeota archaeon]
MSEYLPLWDIFGIVLTITLFENLLLIYLNLVNVNKKSKFGYRLYIFCYICLVFIILGMLGMMQGNLLSSITISNSFLGGYALNHLSYFGILSFGIILVVIDFLTRKNPEFWGRETRRNGSKYIKILRLKEIGKKIIIITTWIGLCIGAFCAFITLFGVFEFVTTQIAVFSSQYGIFLSFIFLANTIILIKIKRGKWNRKKFRRVALTGILISISLLSPFIVSNFNAINAEVNFSEAFGQNWQQKIPVVTNEYFLQTSFSTAGYYLGTPPKDCNVIENVLFYDNESIKLYFDVYMPLKRGEGLPGQNSTLIRIHGGAWVSGDKGGSNMAQMNKYFAAQGYIVFDIQYGLYDSPIAVLDINTPDYNKGDFNIDDMIRHIGEFTKYLSEKARIFGANLNSVFISGSSSGGHLASAAGLALASGNYSNLFSQNITIKGIIPFYPSNGQMVYFGIDGKEEFTNPEKLIESKSPPCLIFQGTHDVLNYFGISRNFRATYLAKGNVNCAIIWMLLGGHTSDFYFSGYYNQIFLYYMERFMYLHQ